MDLLALFSVVLISMYAWFPQELLRSHFAVVFVGLFVYILLLISVAFPFSNNVYAVIYFSDPKSVVECSFVAEFDDHIYVAMDAEAVLFLHDLVTNYVKEKDKGLLYTQDLLQITSLVILKHKYFKV